jgi:putative protease
MPKDLLKAGDVSHYYTSISVAVVELTAALKVGDKITVKGATSNFTQLVESMQIEHKPVEEAVPGDSIGLKVQDRVRKGDEVYKETIN